MEGIRTKDQQLFSLISEGYEILNIRVPTKLPTVDEEESTELQDNLSYLDQTPKIKSRNQEWTQQGSLVLQDEETPAHGEYLRERRQPTESSQPAVESELRPQRDGASDIDYFEKFTLVDAVGPGEHAREEQETGRPAAKGTSERSEPVQETPKDGLPASEDSFVIVSDADIVGEHLDEVFYGGGAPAERGYKAECGAGTRSRRESQRSAKESGSVLFETEETTLTPIFISPGPPKIIDPILLEEPAAMSFMYSDLYEDAVGERRKSDEEHSESESVASEKTSRRRLSDAEEADGYLEKFILKDETPTVELPPESAEDRREGGMMWAQRVDGEGRGGEMGNQSCQSQREEEIMDQGAATVTDESVGVVVAAGGQDTPTGSETETSQWEEKGAVASSSVEATAEWDAAASGEGTDKCLEEEELHMELQEPGRAKEEEFTQDNENSVDETAAEDFVLLVPKAPAEDAITHQEEVGKHEGVVSSLRSFIPQEESSGLEEDMSLEAESPDVNAEELDYEVICEQEAEELRGAEEPEPEPEPQQELTHLSPEEEQIEDDYEVFDAEEERQARLAAELQGLDWFCFTCGDLLSKDERASEEHRNHEVADVDAAYEQIKERLSGWISELQEGSENLEDLVSDLEVAYNSVEEQCVEVEAAMRAQNEEMMALVMDQYNDMSVGMEEEKKAKLEQIYDQIVSVQDSIDSARTTLETTAREAETEARMPEDINARLKAAWESAASLELGPQVLMVFEDYAKGHTSSSHVERCKGIPVPQRPRLQPQEPGSATSTSVTVYWRVGPGDVIDCFQVYCMEEPRGVVSEEYRVTVKESSCVLEELEPDKTYKVWVMAVNYTGCSLPSDQLAFRTAPSVPVIDAEQCTVLWDSATLRWSPSHQVPQQRFTLEYCRQYEPEGEGLRSISGIGGCERKVPLQPNENYLFYIKAANEAGTSEQSEAALVSTRGTRFQLLGHTAHPALELSADRTTLHYCHQAPEGSAPTDAECPSILGELLLPPGRYYWETVVTRGTAYRLGVVTGAASRRSPLGENSLSWCLQCVPAVSGYHLLHINIQSSLFVTETPERVGTLLDYQLGRLSFYNAHSGQLLGAFCQRFAQPCHPALALEMPGSLEVSMVLEMPDFLKNS
uniref:Cardiomyopathy associated 5 n=1 Tax=Tetraodon nigroviridis TaxID=99883 RepID=H3DD86_TETNG